MVTVRTATLADAPDILEIYAPFVLTTAVSFETLVPSVKEMESRIEKCLLRFPWLVFEIDGKLRGYAYASAHREREAYQWTCESSIYLHPDSRGKGVGKPFYECLFHLLTLQNLVNVYGGITLPNEASTKLHEKCGFEQFVIYDNVGYKFNSWHKVGWWRRQLNAYQLNPSPPISFLQLNPLLVADHFRQTAAAIQSQLTG